MHGHWQTAIGALRIRPCIRVALGHTRSSSNQTSPLSSVWSPHAIHFAVSPLHYSQCTPPCHVLRSKILTTAIRQCCRSYALVSCQPRAYKRARQTTEAISQNFARLFFRSSHHKILNNIKLQNSHSTQSRDPQISFFEHRTSAFTMPPKRRRGNNGHAWPHAGRRSTGSNEDEPAEGSGRAPYKLQSPKVLVTWPKAERFDEEEAITLMRGLGAGIKLKLAREDHADGTLHYHAYLEFESQPSIRDAQNRLTVVPTRGQDSRKGLEVRWRPRQGRRARSAG